MIVFSLAFWLGVGCGGAAIWFGKLQIQKLILGAQELSAKLHAKADAIAAAAKKL